MIKEGIRYDYLVSYSKIQNFIELKGEDIKHTLEQLKRTVTIFGKDKNLKKCYIVSSRSPLPSPEIQNHKLLFKKKHNADLFIKNIKIEVK